MFSNKGRVIQKKEEWQCVRCTYDPISNFTDGCSLISMCAFVKDLLLNGTEGTESQMNSNGSSLNAAPGPTRSPDMVPH